MASSLSFPAVATSAPQTAAIGRSTEPSYALPYRGRNRIERLVNRPKQYRRVATRYEKRAAHYLAMLTLAAIVCWL